MSRRLRQTAAGLLAVCAALFIVVVTAEGDTHAETTSPESGPGRQLAAGEPKPITSAAGTRT